MINQTPSHGINLRYARAEPDGGAGGGGGAPAAPAAGGSDAAAGGAAPAAPAAPVAPRIEKVKVRVNGKEVEQEIPYEKLIAGYQKGLAADETFRTAAQQRADAARIQKENEQFQQLVLKDPIAAMRQLRQRMKDAGSQEEFDEVKFLTERLEAKLNESEAMKDPRERALAEERRRREEAEGELERQRQEREEQEHQAAVAKKKEEYAQIFSKALTHVKLPQNPFTMQSMARAFKDAKQHLPAGMNPTPEELAEAVDADLAEVVEKSTEGLEGEALLTRYPSLTKRIYAALKARATKKPTAGQNAAAPNHVPPPPKPVGTKPPGNTEEKRARTPWDLKTI